MGRDRNADKVKSKRTAMQRRADLIEKESAIDAMLCDSAYLSKVSAIASAHSFGGSSPTPSKMSKVAAAGSVTTFDEDPTTTITNSRTASSALASPVAPSPLPAAAATRGGFPLTEKALARMDNSNKTAVAAEESASPLSDEGRGGEGRDVMAPMAILSDAATVASSDCGGRAAAMMLLSPTATADGGETAGTAASNEGDDENEGFASCLSTLRDVAVGATAVAAPPSSTDCTVRSTATAATFAGTNNPSAIDQYEKDCQQFPWYREASEALNGYGEEGYYDEEGYEDYLFKVNGSTAAGAFDNPYALSAAEWWAREREERAAVLAARLSKAKRLAKTGSERHAGTNPSARRKENQKVEVFTLKTSNRFGGLKKI